MDGNIFDAVAERYDRIRPGYPDAAVEQLMARAGTRPGADVLEIGAGTGQLSTMLLERGFRLTCLEPGTSLATILRRKLPPDAPVIVARFEDWDAAGATFDLIVAATAFHWLDLAVALPKIGTLLRPDGALGLLWNEHISSGPDDPFNSLIQPIYDTIAPGLGPKGPPETADEIADRRALLREAGVEQVERVQVRWDATYSTDELIDLLGTYSNHVSLDPRTRQELFAAIRRAVDGHGGAIRKHYLTDIYVARADALDPVRAT